MSDHNSVFGHSAPTDSEPQSSSTQSLRPAKIVLGLAITLLAVWFVWWLFSGKSEPDKLGWGGVTCENPIGASTPIRDVWEAHSFKEVYFCLYRLPTGDRLKIKRVRPNGEVLLIELDE